MSQNWTYSEASRELDRIINSASSPILLSSKKPPASLTKSIHFLDADTPMKEVRNLFSSPSSLNRSAINSNTVSSTASSHHITSTSFTDTMHLLEAKHSATSVVSAFRELQNKVKLIESERTSALRVRDELRQSLTDAKKNSALDKSRHELRNTEQILVLRQQISEVADEKVYLEETLKRAVDREKQSSDCLSERKKTLVALQDKTREQEEHEMHLQMRIDSTAKELSCVLRRCDAINYQISLGAPAASPSSVRPSTLSQRLEEMQEQLREESNLVIRYDASIGSLTEYLKLLIDLNNSLLAAVSSSRSLRKQTQLEYEINLLLLAAQKLGISRESGDSQVDPKLLKAPHIYDNALISAATRAATSTRRKPPNRKLLKSASRVAATAAATALLAASTTPFADTNKAFLPSGVDRSSRNVLANVSKANKAAKRLNATIASRVKSLNYSGQGSLHCDVGRINLVDMKDVITTIKQLARQR